MTRVARIVATGSGSCAVPSALINRSICREEVEGTPRVEAEVQEVEQSDSSNREAKVDVSGGEVLVSGKFPDVIAFGGPQRGLRRNRSLPLRLRTWRCPEV